VPTPDGKVVKRSVTRKWLEQMQAEGRISQVDQSVITVHMLDVVKGYYVTSWIVGTDVTDETAAKFRDASTDALYAMKLFRDGQPQTHVLVKHIWDEAKQRMRL
jgi:hypothetical protein